MTNEILPQNEKHTPGPWMVDLDGPFTLGGDVVSIEALSADGKSVDREICTVMLDTDDHPDGNQFVEDAANARLIAAAPQLLTALRSAHHALRSYQYGNNSPELAQEIADVCEKALQNAKGETL